MMKLKIVISALGLATMASASQLPNPLLVKSVSAGFTMPEYRVSTKCEVYADKVVKLSYAGTLAARTETKIALSGDVSKLIEEAKAGKITQKPAPTDGPITTWMGIQTVGAGAPEQVVLRQRGSLIRDNDAKSAVTLINFLDLLCK